MLLYIEAVKKMADMLEEEVGPQGPSDWPSIATIFAEHDVQVRFED